MARNSGRLGTNVTFQWNETTLRHMLYGEDGEVGKDVTRRARAVLRKLQTTGPHLSGTLRRSWRMTPMETTPSGPSQGIETDVPYVWPLVSGRKRVVAGPGKMMPITVTGGGAPSGGSRPNVKSSFLIFRKSAKATKPNDWVEQAVGEALQ